MFCGAAFAGLSQGYSPIVLPTTVLLDRPEDGVFTCDLRSSTTLFGPREEEDQLVHSRRYSSIIRSTQHHLHVLTAL